MINADEVAMILGDLGIANPFHFLNFVLLVKQKLCDTKNSNFVSRKVAKSEFFFAVPSIIGYRLVLRLFITSRKKDSAVIILFLYFG